MHWRLVVAKFYANGLKFSCQKCSACCRFDPGYVFLTQPDVTKLALATSLSYINFIQVYCRWIPSGNGRELLSLKEKANYDCIMWGENGCGFYKDRPLQCKTFPFWESSVSSFAAWNAQAETCPGMNNGELHSQEEIDVLSTLHETEAIVLRSN